MQKDTTKPEYPRSIKVPQEDIGRIIATIDKDMISRGLLPRAGQEKAGGNNQIITWQISRKMVATCLSRISRSLGEYSPSSSKPRVVKAGSSGRQRESCLDKLLFLARTVRDMQNMKFEFRRNNSLYRVWLLFCSGIKRDFVSIIS